jgi:hypothetical protein
VPVYTIAQDLTNQAISQNAEALATTDGKPPTSHEDHELWLGY